MTDYFALLGEARRPWGDPEELKEKYFARSRAAAPDADLNEGFRVLNDPKLRLHHLLILEGAELSAGRPVPPSVAELFWNTGTVLREVDRWLLKSAEATSALSRALLSGERNKIAGELQAVEEQLHATYGAALERARGIDDAKWRSDLAELTRLHDEIAYLTRLREQVKEKQLRLSVEGDFSG
ncbi:MAG: hypothetical protein M3Q46_05070 [Verrucomicrobiota bacterium]|nr:hypothetical protein [Verrucomicrobiota bacterium]